MPLNRSPSAPSAGIPEDLQPAAWDHSLGETRLQTVPPGEKSFGGSSVPPGKKNPSATREGAQPQPGAVSPPLGAGGGQAQILVPVPFGGLVFAHLLLQTSCNAHSPREEGLGGVSHFTPATMTGIQPDQPGLLHLQTAPAGAGPACPPCCSLSILMGSSAGLSTSQGFSSPGF